MTSATDLNVLTIWLWHWLSDFGTLANWTFEKLTFVAFWPIVCQYPPPWWLRLDQQFTKYCSFNNNTIELMGLRIPIFADQCIPGQTTILVVAEGVVEYKGHKPENFSQTFILTAKENTWKVASDCLRFYDKMPWPILLNCTSIPEKPHWPFRF